MAEPYVYLTFLALHIGLGRKISIPSAMALGINTATVVAMGIALDVMQIPFFLAVYGHTARIPWFRSLSDRLEKRSHSIESSRLVRWARTWGTYGTVLVAAMPIQGGGMWSGVLLAYMLRLKRWQTYVFLTIGSVLGCCIIALGITGILRMF